MTLTAAEGPWRKSASQPADKGAAGGGDINRWAAHCDPSSSLDDRCGQFDVSGIEINLDGDCRVIGQPAALGVDALGQLDR